MPAFAARDLRRLVRPGTAAVRRRRAPRGPLAGHVQQSSSPGNRLAATHCLEAAGYEVVLPDRNPSAAAAPSTTGACSTGPRACWRTDHRHPPRRDRGRHAGVGLEPACVAAFKDELVPLPRTTRRAPPQRADAYFSDFLAEPGSSGIRRTGRRPSCSALQPPCRSSARAASATCSTAAGVDHRVLPSGCCGMAGRFGFDAAASTRSRPPRRARAPAPP
jgi:hypothetical protein